MTTWLAAAAAVLVVLAWRWRQARRERAGPRAAQRCHVPPLPPQTNVVQFKPTGLGGVR